MIEESVRKSMLSYRDVDFHCEMGGPRAHNSNPYAFLEDLSGLGPSSSFPPSPHTPASSFTSFSSYSPRRPSPRWSRNPHSTAAEYVAASGHVYVEDGTLETRRDAFVNYHFSARRPVFRSRTHGLRVCVPLRTVDRAVRVTEAVLLFERCRLDVAQTGHPDFTRCHPVKSLRMNIKGPELLQSCRRVDASTRVGCHLGLSIGWKGFDISKYISQFYPTLMARHGTLLVQRSGRSSHSGRGDEQL